MKQLYIPLFIGLLLVACDIKDNSVSPNYNFTHVYVDEDASNAYYPVDAMEASDGSIIILSALTNTLNTNYPTIQIIKTSASGQLIWQTNVDPAFVSPVPSLMQIGNTIQFICMDDNSFKTKLMNINLSTGMVNEIGENEKTYPLAAHYAETSNSIVVLSYDGLGTNTIISGYTPAMGLTFRESTPTNKDFSYDIFQHLKKQGNPFPFFINSFENSGSTYYSVNAFSNYTLSLLFVNHSSGTISGRVNGYQELGGIAASINKSNDLFAVAESHFNTGEISINTEASIDINGTQNVTQLNALGFPELTSDSNVKIIKETINEKEFLIYAATTKTNQLALYFFDALSNELLHTEYLGHTNPVEISSFFKANDDGLVITGKTWVAGRYQRVILFKVATDKIKL